MYRPISVLSTDAVEGAKMGSGVEVVESVLSDRVPAFRW